MPAGGHVNVALQVFRVSHLVGQALDQALEPVDLDGDEFAVLSVLRVHQPVRSTDLADILKMPPSALARRLERLERRRLVRHRREKSGGRGRVFEVTPLGVRRLEACYPIFRDFVETVERRLGVHLRAVQDALGELQGALEEHGSASTREAAPASS